MKTLASIADQFAEEHYVNPSDEDKLIIYNAMLVGWLHAVERKSATPCTPAEARLENLTSRLLFPSESSLSAYRHGFSSQLGIRRKWQKERRSPTPAEARSAEEQGARMFLRAVAKEEL